MKLVITADLANAVLQYLGSRPYTEVFKLVSEIQKLEPLPEAGSEGNPE